METTINTAGTYTGLCAACRADGIVSVERANAPALGCCACCGDPLLLERWQQDGTIHLRRPQAPRYICGARRLLTRSKRSSVATTCATCQDVVRYVEEEAAR